MDHIQNLVQHLSVMDEAPTIPLFDITNWENFFAPDSSYNSITFNPIPENSYENLMFLTLLIGGASAGVMMLIWIPIFPAVIVFLTSFIGLVLLAMFFSDGPRLFTKMFFGNVYREALFFFMAFWIKLFRMTDDAILKLLAGPVNE